MQESIEYRLLKLYEYAFFPLLSWSEYSNSAESSTRKMHAHEKYLKKKLGPRSLAQVSIYIKLKTHNSDWQPNASSTMC